MTPLDERPGFIVDSMLGSLARWLRILGYDTLYFKDIEDPQLVELSRQQDRLLLTKDRKLVERRRLKKFLLIEAEELSCQLLEVLSHIQSGRDDFQLFTRCPECNGELQPVAPASIRNEVPAYVFETQEEFKRCSGCDRIYWPGTHRSKMLERLAMLRLA